MFRFRKEIKDEPYWELETCSNEVDTIFVNELSTTTAESFVKIEEKKAQKTFDGNWSNDYDDDEEINHINSSLTRRERAIKRKENLSDVERRIGGIALAKHKIRNLRGVPSCRYCDSIFPTKAEKRKHVCKYLQCDEKNFICRFCGKERSKATFSNHVHESLECQYCGRKILNPRNMKLHIEKKHKGENYKPPRERKQEDLEAYLKQKEKEEGEVYAQREQIRLEEYNNRIRKLRENYGKKNLRYHCDLCGNQYAGKKSLEYHMNMHLNIPLTICENCGISIFTPSGIKSHSCHLHSKKDHRTIDTRYCRYCNITFLSSIEKKNHKCEYQIDNRNKICRFCRKTIPKSSFNHHMEIHTDDLIFCDICNKQFSNKRCLKVHMLIHQEDKPFQCESCSERFINKRNLEYHKRFHGEKLEKSFKCEHCFTTLCSEFSLKNHIQRKHTSSAICEICKTVFDSRELLKEHIKSTHEPFQCSICAKRFALPRYLKVINDLIYFPVTPSLLFLLLLVGSRKNSLSR